MCIIFCLDDACSENWFQEVAFTVENPSTCGDAETIT